MTDDDPGERLDRRAVLATVAAVGGAGLAGCTEETRVTPTSGGTTSPADEGTSAPATGGTDVPLEEPVDVTDDDRCAVCNMKPAMYPEWNAQLSLELPDQPRAHFCSPGCMVAARASPGEFFDGATRDDIVGFWSRDYASKELVDATNTNWVLELNADRIEAPMMRNPLSFENEDDALGYVEQYDDLTKHDVVSLATFDLPLAHTFRAKFLPETDEPSVLEAAAVPDDASCGVCQMTPAEFPEANGQLSFEDGDRTYFCSPGCLTAYYGVPSHFDEGRAKDDVVGAWTHDYGAGDAIDAMAASFVLETDASRVDLPMMKNPVPFAKRADALGYVEKYDDLTGSDVLSLLAFDEELARTYRKKFF